MEHFIPSLSNNEDSSNILDKLSESWLTIILPSKLEDTDFMKGPDLISPWVKWKDESQALKESAISSMKTSRIHEMSKGEKSFLKDLHKQFLPT